MDQANVFESIFDSSALSAKEQVTEWVKIKEKLGTRVGGYFVGAWVVPAKGVYREQIGVAIRDVKNPEIVYGVSLASYMLDDVSKFEEGDLCGFEYYKDIPSKTPGLSATKAVRWFNKEVQDRVKNGSVKQNLVPVSDESGDEVSMAQNGDGVDMDAFQAQMSGTTSGATVSDADDLPF
jgi:hypothetical protein